MTFVLGIATALAIGAMTALAGAMIKTAVGLTGRVLTTCAAATGQACVSIASSGVRQVKKKLTARPIKTEPLRLMYDPTLADAKVSTWNGDWNVPMLLFGSHTPAYTDQRRTVPIRNKQTETMQPRTYQQYPRDGGSTRAFLPTDLLSIYNLPPQQFEAVRAVHIVILSFGGGLFGTLNPDGTLTGGDCQNYWQMLNLWGMPTVKILLLDGMENDPKEDDGASTEDTIDVEMAGACCPNSLITLIIGNSFQTMLQAAWGLQPTVVSCSWGFPESADPAQCHQIDQQLAHFARAGISVFCASGDSLADDGQSVATTDFPGCSPNVVCCGGTRLISPRNVYGPDTKESVWNSNGQEGAGGGFSRIFPVPKYQLAVVAGRSPGMRMCPDICSVADPQTGCVFRVNGSLTVVGGTSIAAPFLAGCFARLGLKNEFANLVLYRAPKSCFHDITMGTIGEGFDAAPGFDLASGWGTLNGTALLSFIHNDHEVSEEINKS